MSDTIPWYKHAVIYQIYPRSFADSNGDGVGDLQGITNHLDYLADLGVDALWLSPIFESPMADFGYDISDYQSIDPDFGTLADCERLIKEAHRCGLKILMDLVPNHSSSQHPWFLESKSSSANAKRDWYVWKDPKPDGSEPNNWGSVFGGPAWTFDETTNQYYLHSFLKEQPDLNWANPEVQRAIQEAMRFWYDRGVDGFRVDAILFTAKDADFRDNPDRNSSKMMTIEADSEYIEEVLETAYSYGVSKHLAEYIGVLTEVTKEYDERCLFLEAYPDNYHPQGFADLYKYCDTSVAAFFYFGLLAAAEGWEADKFKHWVNGFQAAIPHDGIPTYVLGNHDISRLVSRIGRKAAPAAALALLTLPGAKFIYYGEELGMADVSIPPDLAHDPSPVTRDPERTPMQWTAGPQAGFSRHTPWLPLERDYKHRNVETLAQDEQSLLRLYRHLISLHRDHPALRAGDYLPLTTGHAQVFGFKRTLGKQSVTILINFSAKAVVAKTKGGKAKLLASSRMDERDIMINLASPSLRPYEAIVAE